MAQAAKPSASPPRWLPHSGWVLGLALSLFAFWDLTPLMTGEVSRAHAGIERRCTACHPSDATSQDTACRRCHPTIGTSSPAAIHRSTRQACATCHHEHRSREYPLRLDDPDAFAHQVTGFPLDRWHTGLACDRCHKAGRPYHQVRRECVDCHPSWSPGAFDHRKLAGVALVKHAALACTDCHPQHRYSAPPACTACHAPDTTWHRGQPL